MSPQARRAAGNATQPDAGVSTGEDAGPGPFVINLTSSTTPMALTQPDAPELKQFTFFVSRRREDNRERFRLHMGYFATLAEAEEWLNVIRDLYPQAWAGEAPGKKLRARAAAAELAKQLPAPPPIRAMAPPPAPVQSPPPPKVAALPTPQPEIVVPTLQAAPPVAPAPALQPAIAASAAPMLEAVAQAAAALAAAAKTAVAQTAAPPVVVTPAPAPAPAVAAAPAPKAPVVPAKPAAPRAAAPATPAAPTATAQPNPPAPARAPARAAQPAAAAPPPPPARLAAAAAAKVPQAPAKPKKSVPNALTASNVREVMAALDDGGETRQIPAPTSARGTSPASRPAAEKPRTAAPAARAPAAAPAARDSLTDTQVLRMLENRRPDGAADRSSDDSSGISLLKPDDTQTRRALKEAVVDNAPVSFAVQLQWSVQPVELDKVPPLAIFSAYTLYTVEGSREGRKWYGLRLGFFSDAISAKQVAYYVRSEFASVAVVPVSPAEKARASEQEAKAATGAFQKKPVEQRKVEDEFKLFDDDKPEPPPPPPKPAAEAKPATRGGPVRKKPLGRVKAKEQRSPKTLEETLEILGASELEIDNDRGELLNDTGVRHLRVEVQKNTPFAKLLDRISERVRKN